MHLAPLYESVLAAQAWFGLRAAGTLDALGPLPEPTQTRPPVSLIVSALVPGRRLERLLVSIQPLLKPADELIVVVGPHSDQARAVASEFGARIVETGDAPAGWRRTTHAGQAGADAATRQWLLFLDATVWVESADLVDRLFATGLQAVSIFPRQETVTFAERLMVPFAYRHYFAGRTRLRTLNAQCLLISREAYDLAGGHAAVRNDAAEDMALAARLREHGVALVTLDGRSLLAARTATASDANAIGQEFGGAAFTALRDDLLPGALTVLSAVLAGLPALVFLLGIRRRSWTLLGAASVAWLADARSTYRFARSLSGRDQWPAAAFLQPLAQAAFVISAVRALLPTRAPARGARAAPTGPGASGTARSSRRAP